MCGMDTASMTLDAYLDEWMDLLRTRVQPTTWRGYDDMSRAYLRPGLGACRIDELTVRQLNLHFVHLLAQGGRRGGPLARKTVKYAHAILRQALGDAVRADLLADNVAARVTLPKLDPERDLEPEALRTWTAEQAARFLALSADAPLHALWRVALGTGMRRGELLGLRWQDVDLTVPELRVRASLAFVGGRHRLKSTKTGRGRVLTLDDDTAAAIARQPPPSQPEWPLVFTTPDGGPWRPEIITDRWRRQWPALDLPKLRLHDLRHCHACLLLDQGVPIKVVSERLGHSTIVMTMDVYAHVLPAQDRDAANAIQRALRGTSGTDRTAHP
jgi:integrase